MNRCLINTQKKKPNHLFLFVINKTGLGMSSPTKSKEEKYPGKMYQSYTTHAHSKKWLVQFGGM